MKSLKLVVPMLVALSLAAMLSGCGTNTTPTGLDPALDQAPPALPIQIVAEIDASAGDATLDWTPSPSVNAAGYEIYQYLPCPQIESAYALVGRTDAATTAFTLPWTPTQTVLYYRLRTVSSTGVKSALSAPILATVGTPVGGDDPDPIGTTRRVKP